SVTIKLCPTNYFAWKQLMLTFLESHRLSGFVDGTITPPNKPSLPRESTVSEDDLWEEEVKRRRDRKMILADSVEYGAVGVGAERGGGGHSGASAGVGSGEGDSERVV
ncbi:hypothetical protein C3L33_23558, partial [Rhododendron williamsianum]